jgi:hypothetical protein
MLSIIFDELLVHLKAVPARPVLQQAYCRSWPRTVADALNSSPCTLWHDRTCPGIVPTAVTAVQLAAEAPEALRPGDVGVLAEFLAGKLSDW